MKTKYECSSVLAPYINNYLAEKRSLGFQYRTNSFCLYNLDRYWLQKGYTTTSISKGQLEPWLYPPDINGKSAALQQRCIAVRGFATYMNALGHECYVPVNTVKLNRQVAHIFSSIELKEFFAEADSYRPLTNRPRDQIVPTECPLIFRMLYCCGMRINEACKLRTSDVDLVNGIVTIMNGKNQKDRIVYLPDDLKELLKNYRKKLTEDVGYNTFWFFPCGTLNSYVHYGRVEEIFNICWDRTEASKHCGKKPTPHCFRHTFVVNRINRWIAEGIDLNVMLTYLSKYLGHQSPEETFYYYHLVQEAFEIVRKKDVSADEIIPEVTRV